MTGASPQNAGRVPSVGSVERKIKRVEGFKVRIKYLDGTDVRSDRNEMPPYPYRVAARDLWTVEDWKRERFRQTYPGFNVDVLRRSRESARGNSRLETVRADYADG